MYQFYSEEKLKKLYPILETNCDAIINFVSCDGVMGYKLSAVLGSLYPEQKYNFQEKCKNNLIQKGTILTSRKSYPFIIQLPFKETFKSKTDEDYVIEGFKKLELAVSTGKVKIDSIAIQKGIISEDILIKATKELKNLEIKFYDEIDPYENKEKVELK